MQVAAGHMLLLAAGLYSFYPFTGSALLCYSSFIFLPLQGFLRKHCTCHSSVRIVLYFLLEAIVKVGLESKAAAYGQTSS